MIWPTDAVQLATTKLKTRKVRLVITIIVTSLLFSVLAFLASVSDGTIKSLGSFSQEGYGKNFFVQATPLTVQPFSGPNQPIDPELLAIQKDLIARKKATAKRLSLMYDEKTDQALPLQSYQSGPAKTDVFPNFNSQIVNDRLEKKNSAIPGTSLDEFRTMAVRAGAGAVYSGTQAGVDYNGGGPNGISQVSVLKNGQEDYEQMGTTSGPPDTKGINSIKNVGWRSADSQLLQPFVLPGQTLALGNDNSIPIIAPFSAAEEILGLKPLPQTATPAQKLERLTMVRKNIAGKSAQLCYRNSASTELISQTIQQQKEIADNKNKSDYTAPALLYNLPAEPCAPVTIKSDKRSDEEKTTAAHQKTFDDEFGLKPEPVEGIITVRLIGLNPDIGYGPSISPAAILSGLFTSSIGGGWVSPAEVVVNNQLAANVQGSTAATAKRGRVIYYAKFASLGQVESFIKGQTCTGLMKVEGPTGSSIAIDTSEHGDSTANCIKQGKVYSVSPYGNSAGAVEKFRSIIWKVARVALAVIVVLAALIMMGNIGKIIADSRRETAVFRALGAKRIDIAEIYLTYTALLSLLIALCAVAIGSLAAAYLNSRFSADISLSAVLAYNAQDVHKQFLIVGFNPVYVLAIVGLTILTGILSAVLPLIGNTRRNPIKDMRDDT